MSEVKNIETIIQSTHDEFARQRFVSVLRKRILVDYAEDMQTVYRNAVEPRFEKQHGRKPSHKGIHVFRITGHARAHGEVSELLTLKTACPRAELEGAAGAAKVAFGPA